MIPSPQFPNATPQSNPAGNIQPIKTVGIIGAGVMGRGIAAANLRAGMRVLIHDIDSTAANFAVGQLRATVDESLAPLITVATNTSEFSDVDLLIESVAENIAVKSEVLGRVESLLSDKAMIATNSSGIPISQLATSLKNPSRFCGLHFCHPVLERPLVEIIGANSTDKATLESAWQYALSIRMSPLIVGDSPGFLLNRLLMPYLNEAVDMMLDGVSVESLDQAAKEFGMRFGPLEQFDEFGIDVTLAVARRLYWAFPDRIVPSDLIIRMFKLGRLGRKTGRGFYSTSPETGVRGLDPEICEMIRERLRGQAEYSEEYIRQRLFLPMLVEATRVLEERLVESPQQIDLALKNGLGMTETYEGLFAWADKIGTAKILELLSSLLPLGKRFEPTETLRLRK